MCGNCMKSKRQCQGYNQRVIFKDPLNTFRVSASVTTPNSSLRRESTTNFSPTSRDGRIQNVKLPPQGPLPNIAPKLDSPAEKFPMASTSLHTFPGQLDQVTEHDAYSTYKSSGDRAPFMVFDDSS